MSTTDKNTKKTNKNNAGRIIYALGIILLMVICFLISRFLFQLVMVDGDSMEPELQERDLLIIKKFNLDINSGDIIVFNSDTLDDILIKRVIACPGDIVNIKNNNLYINDTLYLNNINPGDVSYPVILGEDEYFVLGDNTSLSVDSRDVRVGVVNTNQIIGEKLF